MATRRPSDRRCSYVVLVQRAADSTCELRTLANYLSTLAAADCDVVVLDASQRPQFDANARVLRWVSRHVAVHSEQRSDATIDVVRAAAMAAVTEKVIVAADDVRYSAEAVAQMCDLLDLHEVVVPQDYFDPVPFWAGVEMGRILLHRGVDPRPDHGSTFGFRRSALRAMRALGPVTHADAQARRLAAVGAEVHPAAEVFVRRDPSNWTDWLQSRPRAAEEDFPLPIKTAFFLAVLPLLALVVAFGGVLLGAAYAGVLAICSVSLALRGRAGASAYFPLRAALLAPVWVLERSVSVYWALFRRLRRDQDEAGIAVPDRATGSRAASGE